MAGNFWHSSHYNQWLLNRQDLYRHRKGDLEILGEEDYQKVTIFFANLIQALGEQLKVRQQVIATATIFFKRFYARNPLQSIDPLLMAPTAGKLSDGISYSLSLFSDIHLPLSVLFGQRIQRGDVL